MQTMFVVKADERGYGLVHSVHLPGGPILALIGRKFYQLDWSINYLTS